MRFVSQKTLAFAVAGIVVVAVLFLAPQGYVERIYSITDSSLDDSGSSQLRWELMRKSVELFLENPVVGVGLGMSRVALAAEGFRWTPVHNVYLQVASEIGLAGILIYLLFMKHLVRGGREAIRMLSSSTRDLRLLAYAHGCQVALIAFIVEAFFSTAAYHFYLFYVAGIGTAIQALASQEYRAHSLEPPVAVTRASLAAW